MNLQFVTSAYVFTEALKILRFFFELQHHRNLKYER